MSIIISQCVGFFAVLFFVISIQYKKKENILFYQTIANFLYAIEYFLLDAINASCMNIVSMIRCLIFNYYDKKKKELPKIVLFVIIIVIIILGIINYNGVLSLIPPIITIIYILSSYQANTKIIRITFIICGFIWIYYNIKVGAYVSLVGNACEIISGIVSLIRFNEKKIVKQK